MSGSTTISNIAPAAGNLRVQTSVYGSAIPLAYGRPRVSGNLIWYGGFTAVPHTSTQSQGGKGGGGVRSENTTFTYTAACIMSLCEGPIASILTVYKGKTNVAGAPATSGLSLATGTLGQAVWGYLTTNYPANALGYSGLAYAYAPAYDLGNDASISNHSFEISTPWEAVATGDANLALVAQDLLTNLRYGANFPTAKAGSFTAWANYCLAQNLVGSPALLEQKAAADWLKYLLQLSNTDVVWSQSVLKYVPLGDLACTANGASYTPNTTPAYDLTEDYFLTAGDEDPLRIERKANEDMYNHVRLEYTNRANQYNTEVVEAKDMADIDRRGLRTKSTQEVHAICDAAVASMLAQLSLQRELGVRNVYKFTLPWTFALLEPLDLVTVTDPYMSLTRIPVRINKINETDAGNFEIEAEDCPIGMASSPAYGTQAGAGFAHNYNAAPGSVTTPAFFEAPIERTLTGLEVYTAVTGNSALWGGCTVWVSLDNVSYKKASRMTGGTRYGTLTAASLSGAASAAVQLVGNGGTLLPGTLADAQALNTLVWLDGATDGGEYAAYQGATLTGANAYTLGGLQHSSFGTTAQDHASGAKWVRVDDAVGKSGPLDLTLIGKTIYFKFTSFNVYGGGEELLSVVTAYSYNITGAMAKLPPPNFDSFLLNIQPDGTRQFTFAYSTTTRPSDFLGAQIRYLPGTVGSPVWATMKRLDDLPDNGFYSQSPVETNALLSGTYTFALCAIDTTYNASKAPLVITATLPDRRLGNVLDEFSESGEGWTGTKTGCAVISGILEATDATTWATTPATWAAWTRWNTAPTSPIVYLTPVRDIGISVGASLNSVADADGTVVQEIRTSNVSAADVLTQGWVSASTAFNARWFQLRITVTATGPAPVPVVRSWKYSVNTAVKKEYFNDVVISTYTGGNRIGVGDIRIPVVMTYGIIKRVSVVIQDSTATAWTWALVDKTVTGPRVQFRANGVLADPAKVDFYVEGA